MATVLDDPLKKQNQFGDAAAPVGFKVVPPTVYAQPANVPAKGPAQVLVPPAPSIVPAVTSNPGSIGADAMAAAASKQYPNFNVAQPPVNKLYVPPPPGPAPIQAQNPATAGAAFGIYPNPNSQFSSHANDAALARGVQANPATGGFQPASALRVDPLRLNATTDPRSSTYGAAPAGAAPAGQSAAPIGTTPGGATLDNSAVNLFAGQQPALPGSAAAAVAPAIPGPLTTPATAGNPADTPAAGGAVTRVGNSYSGTNVSGPISINGAAPTGGIVTNGNFQTAPGGAAAAGFAPGGSRVPATPLADAAIAANQRLNQVGSGPTQGEIDAGKDAKWNRDRTQYLMEQAINHGFSSRKGNSNAAIIQSLGGQLATQDQIAGQDITNQRNNATTGNVAGMREAGDTARLGTREAGDTMRAGMRESGETARAAATNAIQQGRLGVEQADQGLRATAAGFQTKAAQRVEAAQVELQNAKTPEAIRAAQTKILALQGKEATNRYTVVPGGQEIDATSGLARTLPSRVLDNQTGQLVDTSGGAAPAASALPNHVAMLRKDPSLAAQFDAQYGKGAAARALGTK